MSEKNNVEVLPTPRRRRASKKEEETVVENTAVEAEVTESAAVETEVTEDATVETKASETESAAVEEETVDEPAEEKKTVKDIFKEDNLADADTEINEEISKEAVETQEEAQEEMDEPIIPEKAPKKTTRKKRTAKKKEAGEDANNSEIKAAIKEEKEKVLDQMSKVTPKKVVATDKLKGIKSMSQAEKNEAYSDGGVVPLEDRLQHETEGEKRYKDYLLLVNSFRTKTPIKGNISYGEEKDGTYCAVVRQGDFKIYIPAEKLLPNVELDDANAAKTVSERSMILRRYVHQRIGSEIDFVILGINEEAQVAVADRRMAMDIKKASWYMTKMRDGKYAIEQGGKFEARIVAATRSILVVEVHGIEFRLRAKDISYVRIPNIEKEYPVGTTVDVIFTKLERTRKDGKVTVTPKVSVKEANPDPRKKWFDDYSVGAMAMAVVTEIDERGVFVRLGGMDGKQDMVCEFPRDNETPTHQPQIPYIGQKVLCKVTKKQETDEKGNTVYWIYGQIVRRY